MKQQLIFILSILLLFCSACNKENNSPCNFEDIGDTMDGEVDEAERAIMQACRESRLESIEAIESNMIGSWDLVGFGHGWTYNTPQPCASIEITENELIYSYKDENRDETTTHTWEIIEGTNNPYMEIFPTTVGIPVGIYCEEYMYSDATPRDGNMYLYQKTN